MIVTSRSGELAKVRCFRCGGKGWFVVAEEPDKACGQCQTWGFVYALPPVGSPNIPRKMAGQEVLDLDGEPVGGGQ